jgi:hypothetical protein
MEVEITSECRSVSTRLLGTTSQKTELHNRRLENLESHLHVPCSALRYLRGRSWKSIVKNAYAISALDMFVLSVATFRPRPCRFVGDTLSGSGCLLQRNFICLCLDIVCGRGLEPRQVMPDLAFMSSLAGLFPCNVLLTILQAATVIFIFGIGSVTSSAFLGRWQFLKRSRHKPIYFYTYLISRVC